MPAGSGSPRECDTYKLSATWNRSDAESKEEGRDAVVRGEGVEQTPINT